MVLSALFFLYQKRGWATPGSKFTPSKSVRPLRTFQNGRDTHAPGPSKERRLPCKDRPKECILYRTGLEKSSKIPSVCLEGNNVLVCMPSIRAVLCLMGIHKVDETSGVPIVKTGHSSDYLSGRYTHYGRDRDPGQTVCTNHLQSSGDFWVCDKLSEIHSCSIKRDGIFRIFDRLPNYDPSTSSGENSKSKECQHLLDLQVVTVRELAKVLGHLTSTIQAVFPAPLHLRHLQEDKNKALGLHHTYEYSIPLNTQAKEELVWWRDNLEAWNGKALVSGSLIIETDASRKG